jgi:hypothetical protein
MNLGACYDSFVRNSAMHENYARMVAITQSSFITIKNNFGFRNQGHNIMLYGGNEFNNYIISNLVIYNYPSYTLLNSDVAPAAFWVTNPTNFFLNNRAAGGSHDGFVV